MKKHSIILGLFLVIIGTFILTLGQQKVEATFGHHHGPYPTISPTVIPTPFPTVSPCDVEEKFTEAYLYDFEPCVTPSPEVTPEPTPVFLGNGDGRNDGRSDGRAGQQPGDPSCTIPFSAPWGLTFTRLSPTSVKVGWVPSVDQPEHQSIVYGRHEGEELWGVNGLSGDTKEFTLNALPENEHIWVQIVNQKGGCSSRSPWIDP